MISIIPYSVSYEEGIKALCKIPVSGRISLALEREPEYYTGSQVQCEIPEVYVAYEEQTKKVWAVFNVGKRRLWLNSKVEWVRYLCDLRIHPDKQGSSLLLRISKFFQEISEEDKWPAQTIVFSDNERMLKMIEKRSLLNQKSTLPYYHFAGRLVTQLCTFNTKKYFEKKFHVRRAIPSDIPGMQALANRENAKVNYSPYYDFSQLNSHYYQGLEISNFFLAFENDTIVGICGVWDQNSFKQTRITGYDKLLSTIRPIYNLIATTGFFSPLPKAGSILKYLNTHSIVIENRNPGIFSALASEIKASFKSENYDYWMCSLSEKDPLMESLKSIKSRKVAGNYYLVSHDRNVSQVLIPEVFYFESARI
jgi:hypothetical protein